LRAWRAERLLQLPPYLFVEIDRRKRQAIEAGRDVIDFGIGDPDQPTPNFIVDRMAGAIRNAANHRYAPRMGTTKFRETVAHFFDKRFGVGVDPGSEILALIGSKEGIGHLPTAVVNPGDIVLVPEPGYPVYASAAVLAGGICYPMPLREKNGWLPVLGEIPKDVCSRVKLMYLNYPNNPTAACANASFLAEAVAFAREHQILIAHDTPYSEIYFEEPPPSILQVDGAKSVCIEFHSLSKTFNMTGWRIAFAVGNPDALAALSTVKSNLDSGVFQAVQEAGMEALLGIHRPQIREQVATYRRRRDILVTGLRDAGWPITTPSATFYVWTRCPGGLSSMAAASRILDEADVVVIPGAGFGPGGEGHIRWALTVQEERTREAIQRIARISW